MESREGGRKEESEGGRERELERERGREGEREGARESKRGEEREPERVQEDTDGLNRGLNTMNIQEASLRMLMHLSSSDHYPPYQQLFSLSIYGGPY